MRPDRKVMDMSSPVRFMTAALPRGRWREPRLWAVSGRLGAMEAFLAAAGKSFLVVEPHLAGGARKNPAGSPRGLTSCRRSAAHDHFFFAAGLAADLAAVFAAGLAADFAVVLAGALAAAAFAG